MPIEQVLMSKEKWLDFWQYFKGEQAQVAGVELLYEQIKKSDPTLLANNASWTELYREQGTIEAELKTPTWPITREHMAEIMLCPPDSIPDSLMDDYARCVETFGLNRINQAYFLGQCGHESCGLRYPVEIHDGSNYEGRSDLGNSHPGDGVKFAGTGWIQVTGRYNHQRFSDYLATQGKSDPKVMAVGKTYTSEVYPWTISGFWWSSNEMIDYCNGRPEVDQVGARVNGRYLPNGYEDRRAFTARAFRVLGE